MPDLWKRAGLWAEMPEARPRLRGAAPSMLLWRSVQASSEAKNARELGPQRGTAPPSTVPESPGLRSTPTAPGKLEKHLLRDAPMQRDESNSSNIQRAAKLQVATRGKQGEPSTP